MRKTWTFGPFAITWNAPGVVADHAAWAIAHQRWLYGPWPGLLRCVWDMLRSWKHDRHLAG